MVDVSPDARDRVMLTDDGPLRSDAGPGYVLRTLTAMELLARQPASPDELAAVLGVHRRTAVRLLDVMGEAGWIEPDPLDPRRIHLSTKIVSVAGDVLNRTDLIQTGSPFVRRLRDQLLESSHLAVPADGWVVHVIEQASPLPLNVAVRVGDRVPLHASAVGKAIAAFRPDQLDLAMTRGLERYTPNTLTTPELLAADLDRIARLGYAIDDGELYADTRCIAAPVRQGLGDVVAAIGVSGPAVRLTRDRVVSIARDVTMAAETLSAALGYRAAEASEPGGTRPG